MIWINNLNTNSLVFLWNTVQMQTSYRRTDHMNIYKQPYFYGHLQMTEPADLKITKVCSTPNHS